MANNEDCSRFSRSGKLHSICLPGKTNKILCTGKSGGPLIYKERNISVQLGIAIFSSKGICIDGGYMVTFTEVSRYLSWIQNVTALRFVNE